MLDSVFVNCPFCGERFEALVDASAGEAEYVEDCPVCCRPWQVEVTLDREEGWTISLRTSDE